ncbi:hypothetical protein UFOVP470_43 [uncultured Caudovirales phage]|uniref:AAA domain containing protein n=1 Tax=uncultured Caudovirales phage TaxID=2100421 RepID=A0A6J5MHL8_9CAUD|nr:hypothetical protein UFOVP470_43 [uncultured Caudovirales phage]
MRIQQIINNSGKLLRWNKSVHLISYPGIGKSSMVKQIAELHDIPLSTYMLGNATPVDLPGYMIPDKDETTGRMYANNTVPFWAMLNGDNDEMLDTVFDHERGILFFDEFGQADPDVKKAAAPIILDRQIGRHKLPKGWVVWLASNRASDRSGVTRNMDHIINRTCEQHVEGHPEDLMNYMAGKNYSPILRAYVDRRQNIIFGGIPKEQGPFCTPRSYLAACDYLQLCTEDDLAYSLDAMDMETLGGTVGAVAAADIRAFLELHDQLPSKRDVLEHPDTAKVPKGMDGQMVVVQMLAFDVNEDNADAIIKYVRRLSEDMAVTFAKTAAARNRKLLMTKAFTKWTAENNSLLSAVAALSSLGR